MNEHSTKIAALDGRTVAVGTYYQAAVDLYESARNESILEKCTRDRSIAILKEALHRFECLVANDSSVPHFVDWVAQCEQRLGGLLRFEPDNGEADQRLHHRTLLRSTTMLARWVRKDVSVCMAFETASNIYRHAKVEGHSKNALTLFGLAAAYLAELVARFPETALYAELLAACQSGIANCRGPVSASRASVAAQARARGMHEQQTTTRRRAIIHKRKKIKECDGSDVSPDAVVPASNRRIVQPESCFAKYKAVLLSNYSDECISEYLALAAKFASQGTPELNTDCAVEEIDKAVQVVTQTNPQLKTEVNAYRLQARKAELRNMHVAATTWRILQVLACVLLPVICGMFSPVLFVLATCVVSLFLGVYRQFFNFGPRLLIGTVALLLPVEFLLLQSSHEGQWAYGALSFFLVWTTVDLFETTQRSAFASRAMATIARISRRTDGIADEWAYWISRNAPTSLNALLLEQQEPRRRPALRQPLYLVAGCFAVAEEVSGLCWLLMDVLVEQLATPVLASKQRPRRFLKNACTTWAVLLRRPLHLARGDDVPLCALCA